jgi:hypothetical protein
MDAEGLAVPGGRVAFVGIKPVLRELIVELTHEPVPMDLGDNRSRGNGNGKAVSLRNAFLVHFDGQLVGTVDKEEVRPHAQPFDSLHHGPESSLKDIYPVDFKIVHNPDAYGQGTGADFLIEILPLGRGKTFGIVNTWKARTLRKNHRGSYNGTGKRSAASFIYARNKTKTPPVRLPFMESHINRQGFDQFLLHSARSSRMSGV